MTITPPRISEKQEIRTPAAGKERLYYVDNLRALACFLVIFAHYPIQGRPVSDVYWLGIILLIGSPASELFLAISGTVLLPLKIGVKEFYKKRFLKLLPPFVFWSIFGVAFSLCSGNSTIPQALTDIALIPLRPVVFSYWFVYVMAGLYIFAPVVSPFLKSASKRGIEWYLLLWTVTLLLPWIKNWLPYEFYSGGEYYRTLCYFGGFLGYWILGYYLNRYPIEIGMNKKWIALCIMTAIYPLLLIVFRLNDMAMSDYLDNLQIGSAILVAFAYTLAQNIKLPAGIQRFITNIAKYSFGIYLIHIYFRQLVWSLFGGFTMINAVVLTMIMSIFTMAICWTIMWMLSKLPYGRYITGAN